MSKFMTPDHKKKKKTDDDDIDDNDPFGLGEDFYEMMNDQLKKAFSQFPGMNFGNMNFSSDSMKKMYADIFRRMNIDPKKMRNMSPEDIQKMMANSKMGFQGPFVFGMNVGVGPDGKPLATSFGNVKSETRGEPDLRAERDPMIDIYEEDGELVVVGEVPGVDKKDIELRASAHELEIIAESHDESPYSRKYHKIVALPAEINPEIAKARYNNGILEVRLEKLGEVKSKKKIHID